MQASIYSTSSGKAMPVSRELRSSSDVIWCRGREANIQSSLLLDFLGHRISASLPYSAVVWLRFSTAENFISIFRKCFLIASVELSCGKEEGARRMAKGRAGELRPAGGVGAGPRQRAAYYEDYAKPVIVNWPFVLAAAAALFVVGHLANRGAGSRLGGKYKKKSSTSEDSSDRPGSSSSSSGSGRGDESAGRRGNQPMSLAELRALRAEAAEARLKPGSATGSGPGGSKPTPLGSILLLARKVDKLEEETSQFFTEVKDSTSLDPKQEKEHARLLELLTQVQLEIDGVQSDESVRPHRKTQTNRVQKLISALEGIEKGSR